MPRPSPVRDRVRDLLQAGLLHAWSLDALLEQVRRDIGSADYSSVFRALAYLEQRGEAQRVEVGDGKRRWERVEPHHDHVVCTGCGRVAKLGGACRLADATQELSEATGFRVSGHHLVVTGICPDCQSATPSDQGCCA